MGEDLQIGAREQEEGSAHAPAGGAVQAVIIEEDRQQYLLITAGVLALLAEGAGMRMCPKNGKDDSRV